MATQYVQYPSGAGVSTVGAVGSSPNANGASISSSTLTLQPADATNPGVVTSGTQTIGGTKTFSGQLIGKGTATNDNAAAGYIGEYPTVGIGTDVAAAATTVWGNVATITLSAGDWDVTGIAGTNAIGVTVTGPTRVALSLFSGNTTTDHVSGDNVIGFSPSTNATDYRGNSIPNWRVSVTGATTVYLKALFTYSAGSPTWSGRISARRIR
jgi:hypothetical protein